ncbi:MAG: hypothetical protein SV686_10510 [Thermodesulfobacteriota bacterium]|nr:hypothetical protein [Thermodesulfobacteriota bacterium]
MTSTKNNRSVEKNSTQEPAPNRSPSWKRWVSPLLAAFIGLVLILAAIVKSMDMDLFVLQLKDYGIPIGDKWLAVSAWALIVVECTLGVGNILFYRPRLTLALTGVLFLVFQGFTGWAWLTNATEECGCFGVWMKRTPGEAAIENLLLFVLTLLPWIMSRSRQVTPNRMKASAVVSAAVCGCILPFIFGFSLSETEQSPWDKIQAELARLEIQGANDIDLSQGEYLIVLMATDCDHCREVLFELNALSEEPNLPSLVGLCANDEEQVSMFMEESRPAFPIRRIRDNAFWHLLREGDLPRVILVSNRKVLQVWDYNVPTYGMIEDVLSN